MKKKILIITLIFLLLLTGCSDAKPTDIDVKQTEFVQLEAWESKVLAQMCESMDERADVVSGYLTNDQIDTLNRLRELNKYLHSKYQGHAFTIEEALQFGVLDNHYVYMFTADGNDVFFEAVISGQDKLSFKDNYYKVLINSRYDKVLKDSLISSDIEVVALETEFTAMCDSVDWLDFNTEALLEIGSELPRKTTVFVKSKATEASLTSIEKIIQDMRVYGSFEIYVSEKFEKNMDIVKCQNVLEKYKGEVKTKTFQCDVEKK